MFRSITVLLSLLDAFIPARMARAQLQSTAPVHELTDLVLKGWSRIDNQEWAAADVCLSDVIDRTSLTTDEDNYVLAHRLMLIVCQALPRDAQLHLNALERFLNECPPDESQGASRNQRRRSVYRGIRDYFATTGRLDRLSAVARRGSREFETTFATFDRDESAEFRDRIAWHLETARCYEQLALADEALPSLREAKRIAELAKSAEQQLVVLRREVHLLRRSGRLTEASQVLETAQALAAQIDLEARYGFSGNSYGFWVEDESTWADLEPALLKMAAGDNEGALDRLRAGVPQRRRFCEAAMLRADLPMSARLHQLRVKPWIDVSVTLAVANAKQGANRSLVPVDGDPFAAEAYDIVSNLRGLVHEVGQRRSDWGQDQGLREFRDRAANRAVAALRQSDERLMADLSLEYRRVFDPLAGQFVGPGRLPLDDRYGRGSFDRLAPSPWSLPRLPDDENNTTLEFVRYRPFRANAPRLEDEWGSPHYALFCRCRGLSVHDLGECGPIDEMIAALYQHIYLESESPSSKGDVTELTRDLDRLRYHLLGPVWNSIGHEAADRRASWTIIPDGLLWHLPFELLCLPDGRFLIEDYALSYAQSTRSLFWSRLLFDHHRAHGLSRGQQPPSSLFGGFEPAAPAAQEQLKLSQDWLRQWAPQPGRHCHIFADADFDARGTELEMAPVEVTVEPPANQRRAASSMDLSSARRLAHSAAEAQSVESLLRARQRAPVQSHLAVECVEEPLKRMPPPKLLLISTHGFQVSPSRPNDTTDRVVSLDEPPRVWDRQGNEELDASLLRCGLLFTGSNHSQSLTAVDGGPIQDRVLTGAEVLNLHLHGTELVILSACESGVGESVAGSPLLSLREAFHLAGASNVVASHWSVDDACTRELVVAFLNHATRGEPLANSLRQAQLQLIAGLRRERGHAHPFYWSALTLSGCGEVSLSSD